jgi:hypothetical protein
MREMSSVDQVARWNDLAIRYPEAHWAFNAPWFYGALRDDDVPERSTDLKGLIDKLLAREP